MDDALWTMHQQSRALKDLRATIGGLWDDQAARDLNTRYLDPHENDDHQMLVALGVQQDALTQTHTSLALAEEQVAPASEHAQQVAAELREAERDLTDAARYYDVYAGNHIEAQARLPLVEEFVAKANQACG